MDSFYLNISEPNKSCLISLRDIILAQDSSITETVKYGMPCFCFQKKILCYLWIDKKTDDPYILMVDGKFLDHPALESGDRARMKILQIDPNKNLPMKTIKEVLRMGLDIVRNAG